MALMARLEQQARQERLVPPALPEQAPLFLVPLDLREQLALQAQREQMDLTAWMALLALQAPPGLQVQPERLALFLGQLARRGLQVLVLPLLGQQGQQEPMVQQAQLGQQELRAQPDLQETTDWMDLMVQPDQQELQELQDRLALEAPGQPDQRGQLVIWGQRVRQEEPEQLLKSMSIPQPATAVGANLPERNGLL